MIKKLIPLILIVALIMSGCQKEKKITTNDEITVVTTIFPAFDFARAVFGSEENVTMLLKPGSESHSFEPTVKDIQKIENCDVFICNGGESEAWVEDILKGIKTNAVVIKMTDCCDNIYEEEKEGMESSGEEKELDEHVWTSPKNAIKIIEKICSEVSEIDPKHEEKYKNNAKEYIEKIKDIDKNFEDTIKNSAKKEIIVGDRFPFLYFIKEYGLDYYAAFKGCAQQCEASASTVKFLVDKVKTDEIKNVFYIEFSNMKIANSICEETGAKPLLLHSCHSVTKDELLNGETYVSLMEKNLTNIKIALN